MTRQEATPASDTPDKTHPGRFWFEAGLVFLVFFVVAGDPTPGVNEAHYLCRLKHYWDPGFCPGDLFLDSPDAHFTVVWLFGWVTKFTSLEATAWAGRVLCWGLVAIGWQRLISRVTSVPLLAPLAAALMLYATRHTHFAGEWIIDGFEAKSPAYGLVLLALADAIDGRWNRPWLLLGLASAFHALVGGWSVLALGAAAWFVPRPPLRSMLPGLIGGAVLALAAVLPALALNGDAPPEVVAEANEIYVYFRLPHHLALLSMDPDWLADRAGRHLAGIACLGLLAAARVRQERPALRLLFGFAVAAEALSVAGLLISLVGWNDHEWAASLLRYYWHRLADIAVPIAAAAIAVEWIGAGLQARRPAAAAATAALVLGMGCYLGIKTVERIQNPTPRGERVLADPAAWVEMCHWIDQNTEPDALLLVPFNSQTFKWRAQRAEVVTRKDIPQDAANLVEWRRRLRDVFQTGEWPDGKPRWTPSLAKLGAARLSELAEGYGADYALDQAPRRETSTPLRRRASLPIVHRVGPYTLYDLRSASSRKGG